MILFSPILLVGLGLVVWISTKEQNGPRKSLFNSVVDQDKGVDPGNLIEYVCLAGFDVQYGMNQN